MAGRRVGESLCGETHTWRRFHGSPARNAGAFGCTPGKAALLAASLDPCGAGGPIERGAGTLPIPSTGV